MNLCSSNLTRNDYRPNWTPLSLSAIANEHKALAHLPTYFLTFLLCYIYLLTFSLTYLLSYLLTDVLSYLLFYLPTFVIT